jgi:hypothetical protein
MVDSNQQHWETSHLSATIAGVFCSPALRTLGVGSPWVWCLCLPVCRALSIESNTSSMFHAAQLMLDKTRLANCDDFAEAASTALIAH